LIISLGAQIDIDIAGLLPLTGQTLVILTGALFFKPAVSAGAVILYLIMGLMGLPVYAEGHFGWAVFIGPSLGYFIGFLLAAFMISFIRKSCSGNMLVSFTALFTGHLVVLGAGSLFLLRYYSFSGAFVEGFQPFIAGAVVKSALGAAVFILSEKYFTRAQ